jgi:hypothetical protein
LSEPSGEAEAQLDALIDRYPPHIAELGRSLIARMRARLPQAHALVFVTHAFGVGFAPRESAAGVIVSVVLNARWVSLFFFKGTLLDDPAGLLEGGGKVIRHVKCRELADFERPEVDDLIAQAVDLAEPPLDPDARGRLVIFSVPGKRRLARRARPSPARSPRA